MSSRNIGKRAVAKRKVGAPPRVYENLAGEVFSGPGVGTPWQMPIRFLEKSGTPIFVSLTGEGGRKRVFQRSNRAEWIKRLLATLAWKEARIGLGYKDAVVWIGKTRFQPTSDDLKGFVDEEYIAAATSGVRVSAPRKRKVRTTEGDEEMAKKGKKSKKSKKAEKSSGARTPDERAKANPASYCCFLLVTTKKTDEQIGRKIRQKFPDCTDAYDEGTAVRFRRRAIAEEREGYEWVQEITGFRMKNVLSHFDETPRRSSSKKSKKVKKSKKARKGVVKKVHKRPIAKKSGRRVVKKVRRR